MALISQREARRLRRRCEELERAEDERRNAWCREYPGGVNIVTEPNVTIEARTAIHTARLLGHAVVAIEKSDGVLFYALPLGD